jgi:hypothetical protein
VRIGEGGNLLFSLFLRAGATFLLGKEVIQSPGSEIHLQFTFFLSKTELGEYGVSAKWISENVG